MLNINLAKQVLEESDTMWIKDVRTGFVQLQKNMKILIEEIDDLPKTVDGVLLKLSMRIWYLHYSGEIRDAIIRSICYWDSSIPVIYTFDYNEKAPLNWNEIYSTKKLAEEAAEKARELAEKMDKQKLHQGENI